jgi:DNA primase
VKRITQSTIDKIYAALDAVEIIGEFVQLKKRGGNHFGLSPFVNEKTPSFAVSPSKNIWKDFSTGKGGNAIGFLIESEGMTYPEALKHCADKYSIAIEYEGDDSTEDNGPDHTGTLKAISSHAATLFQSQLVAGSQALQYLHDRSITTESIQAFQIGYAPDQWEWLSGKLSNFPKDACTLSGLCFQQDNGKLTDRFRNRIMFPITDHFGKVIAFGGRIFGDGKGAKYINSPASDIYDKSRVLYGLHRARKAIADQDQAILTEGYLDVIMLHQHGHTNAIASCGTALTKEQCQLIRRFTLNVLIVRDSDKAGLAAMVKDVRMLLSQGMYPSVLPLPKGDDPDSFCRSVGGEGFAAHKAKHTRNFVDFLIAMGKRSHDCNEPQGRAAIINDVMEVLAVIQDPVLLHTSQQRLSQAMQVPLYVVAGKVQTSPKSNANAPVAKDHSAVGAMHPHEVCALKIIVNNTDVASELIGLLREIPETSMSQDFAAAFVALCTIPTIDANSLLDHEQLRPIASELIQLQPIDDQQTETVFQDFQRHHLDTLIAECRQRMKLDADKDKWLKKMQALVALRRQM